jgi:hypothetical protein
VAVSLIDQSDFNLNNEFEAEVDKLVKSIKVENIALENGAEGYFVYSDETINKKPF